ncbi:MAG: helix-turn-helix transcriptional regulator [Bacteroidales bacterium]|nr:helix-turn-helix transcriptional regulator [Bacteroidales bacterium]
MYKHIGAIIKEIVKEKNISNRQFAKDMGISETYIYKIFEKEHIDFDLIDRISTILDVSLSEIMRRVIYDYDDAPDESIINEPEEKYKTEKYVLRKDFELLKEQIRNKDNQIKFLQQLFDCDEIHKKKKVG